MKHTIRIFLLLTAAILCACAPLTPAQKQQIATRAITDGDALMLGFLTGGKAGALAGLTAQEIQNIKDRQKTAAKQPAATVNP